MATPASDTAAQVREITTGLERILVWLRAHPDLPVIRVDYLDPTAAEFTLVGGKFEVFGYAADAADALNQAEISVTTSNGGRLCDITVTGWAGPDTGVEIVVKTTAYEEASFVLARSLGDTALPDELIWVTTAAHLRSIQAPPVGDGS